MLNTVTNSINPFKQTNTTWLVELIVNFQYIPLFEELFENIASSLAYFELEATSNYESSPDDKWIMQLYFTEKPNLDELEHHANKLAKTLNILPPVLSLSNVVDIDWVREVQKNFPPLRHGKYFVYGSHYEGKVPGGTIPLLIDAARAFGTGEHATTSCCLLALSFLSKKYHFTNMLDVGCGTGILALAMAKTWTNPVLAVDIDSTSVQIAKENIKINKLTSLVKTKVSNGYQAKIIKELAPFDLIVCNILAKPLIKLAPDLKAHLKPHGIAVLSGLLTTQERMVISSHLSQGLRVKKIIRNNGWSTIILH